MKKYALLLSFLIGASLAAGSANASPAVEALGTCMVDSLTGKERKQLAQRVFFAMAAHPEIKEFSNVSVEARAKINETMAKLVTRLLTETCVEQVKVAAKQDGQAGIAGAFELMGKVAIQELMVNKDVVASVSGYAKFLDQEKLAAVLNQK